MSLQVKCSLTRVWGGRFAISLKTRTFRTWCYESTRRAWSLKTWNMSKLLSLNTNTISPEYILFARGKRSAEFQIELPHSSSFFFSFFCEKYVKLNFWWLPRIYCINMYILFINFSKLYFTSTWLLPSYFSIISDGEEAKRLSYFSDNLFSVFPHKLFLNELLFIFITYIKIFLFYLFIFLHHSPFVTETAPAALPFSGDTRKYFF